MASKDDKPGGFSVSRREFLKTAGVVGAVTAATSPPKRKRRRAASTRWDQASARSPDGERKALDLTIEPRSRCSTRCACART